MKSTPPILESLLVKFKPIIGSDYDRYRNHVCRVFLNCCLLDTDENNREKYAVAAVFHDIGIWTNHTFDYLNPSIEQAINYLNEVDKLEWTDEVTLMISWHHKVSSYHGRHEFVVENFRRADWIDVSLGLVTFGMNRKDRLEIKALFPNKGFHLFLIRTSLKYFLRHPFNPLPMFKR